MKDGFWRTNMKKLISLFTLVSIISLLPQLASTQTLVRFQPDPDFPMPHFDRYAAGVVHALSPKDAFAGHEACAIVDARLVQPLPINQAEEMLQPCMNSLSRRYGMRITTRVDYIGKSLRQALVIRLSDLTAIDNEAFRDLNHALALRKHQLLGHPAELRREALPGRSVMQNAIDRCILPAVMRKIESGQDFIGYYGGCLPRAAELKIKALKQSPGHRLGVMVLSSADQSMVETLNGSVSVRAGNGPG